MRTLLKALPDFFLCILRSLPYLNKTCFHQGGSLAVEGTSQGTIQAVLGSSIQQKILPSLSIYLFIFTYLFIHFFYFLFLYLLFSISLSFIFLYLLVSLSSFFISCETHVQCTRGKVNEEREPKMKMWHLATMKSLQGVT